jgi:hypothetical protein
MEGVFTEVTRQIVFDGINDHRYLVFVGDVHADSPNHDKDRYDWFMKKISKLPQDKVLFIGTGDYNDFMSTSEKKSIKNGVHESTMATFDKLAQNANISFVQRSKPMIGRTLGLIEGNHNWIFADGKTSTEDLAERLGTECLGGMSHMTLTCQIGKPDNRKSVNVYLALHHGKGGGKLAGSTINNVEQLKQIFPCSDIAAMGHDHKRGAVPVISLVPVQGKIKQKRCMLVRAGCFLRSYVSGVESYAVKRMYAPTDMGGVVVKLSFHRDKKETDRIITDLEAII